MNQAAGWSGGEGVAFVDGVHSSIAGVGMIATIENRSGIGDIEEGGVA